MLAPAGGGVTFKRRKKLAERLKALIESGGKLPDEIQLNVLLESGQLRRPREAQPVRSWGYGLEHMIESGIPSFVNDSVYALTDSALYFLWEDYPKGPLHRIEFAEMNNVQTGSAPDGRQDIFFAPEAGPPAPQALGFGIVESYGGLTPRQAGGVIVARVVGRDGQVIASDLAKEARLRHGLLPADFTRPLEGAPPGTPEIIRGDVLQHIMEEIDAARAAGLLSDLPPESNPHPST